jgi:hypothetical protein
VTRGWQTGSRAICKFVIPSEARDLHFAADCRSLASLGMTNPNLGGQRTQFQSKER